MKMTITPGEAQMMLNHLMKGRVENGVEITEVVVSNHREAGIHNYVEALQDIPRYFMGYDHNQKIPAIKFFREKTGVSLKEAKDAVENIPLAIEHFIKTNKPYIVDRFKSGGATF